ncbi:NAD(P)-binding domain-containing protein [[Muricauda] lutisoli]|uniref:NAD(P)-binding domain-containing protein n=1 Tax=[Muricauda] lutisoli TaxID=2816035 RepID=A0ABS3EYR5_9FLAO|nr:NAD(P)-binding domain-containing protein [[Muricauda] lutisoli]MBO0331378.1 NAD(P)-binding domain-containing protein [[Muricauda] lutisoli]
MNKFDETKKSQILELPIAIIGGGPVGLAAAAHLKNCGQNFVLFESAEEVGANILSWGHVNLFSPWEYNIDKVAEKLLRAAMVRIPNKERVPCGNEIVHQYLKPLAELKGIKESIHLNSRVLAVGRKGLDKTKTLGREKLPFSIQVKENGQFKTYSARGVIDASGTWHNPNPMGSGGIFAVGELENRKFIHYGMPDVKGKARETFANKSILVVGGGHSAIGSILALNSISKEFPNTKIHWILRKERVEDVYGGLEADEFKSRGALGIAIEKLVNSGAVEVHTPVYIDEIRKTINGLLIRGTKQEELFQLSGIDEIISSTGTRPDFSFLREVRFETDSFLECVPALTDLIDPNIHSCGTVRPHGEAELRQKEKDFYIVGMKSYGRAPTFLMATGYEQVRSIVAHINGDYVSAKNVELHLPETGVCSSGLMEVKNNETKYETKCGA